MGAESISNHCVILKIRINALARVNPAADGEEVFRVQNFEHQMLAEHCTNGIDVYVTNRRIILLDCQVDSNLQNHTVI